MQSAIFLRSEAALLVATRVYLPILVAAVFVYVATRLFDETKSEGPIPRISLRRFYFAVSIVVVAISGIGYVYIFTRTFYPAIPQEFGGGEPYFQSFAIAAEYQCQLQQLGVVFYEPGITMPLPVLHETDTQVAVWLKPKPLKDGNKKSVRRWPFVVAELDKKVISTLTVTPGRTPPEAPAQLPPQPCNQ